MGYGYPPPSVGYEYGAPLLPGYSYRAPLDVQKPKKENSRMELGMGLLGGTFDGLLIGDMMGDTVEADYQARFSDGIDF
ncbi:putative protein SRC2 [Cocos nucifera]|nr:putative protein SRC2 [Cocos nucifera]